MRKSKKGTTAMPVKFHCPKCGRRFVDWGAEKLGFKCPDCEGEELVRAGVSEDRPAKRSSLKRGARKLAPVEPIADEVEFLEESEVLADVEVEDEAEEEEEVFVPVEEEEAPGFVHSPTELITTDADEDEVDLDIPVDLNFGDVAPTLPDETFEEAEEDPWHE